MRIPIEGSLRLVWKRTTSSWLITIFTLLSFIYCILQIVFSVNTFHINQRASNTLKTLYVKAGFNLDDYAHYSAKTGIVTLCETIRQAEDPHSCPVIWPLSLADKVHDAKDSSFGYTTPQKVIRPITESINIQQSSSIHGGQRTLLITGLPNELSKSKSTTQKPKGGQNETLEVSSTCMRVVKWPLQIMLDDKREDLAFIFFQLWVFGLSFIAVLNESVPHILASFISHTLVAIWSIFTLVNTFRFQQQYDMVTHGVGDTSRNLGPLGKPGACDGVDLLPGYFNSRRGAVLAVSIFNFVAVVGSGYFTYKLFNLYKWKTFKRVGASVLINRIYTLVLVFSIFIQLGLFFLLAATGVWVDQLFSGQFGSRDKLFIFYRVLQVLIMIILAPWVILGWNCVRREHIWSMNVFIALSVVLNICWILELVSHTWRLTYLHWPFFAVIQTLAIVLTVATTAVGILCRVYCFGRGLMHYLNPEEDDVENLNPAPDVPSDAEKIEWPGGAGGEDGQASIDGMERGIYPSNSLRSVTRSRSGSEIGTDLTYVGPVPLGLPRSHSNHSMSSMDDTASHTAIEDEKQGGKDHGPHDRSLAGDGRVMEQTGISRMASDASLRSNKSQKKGLGLFKKPSTISLGKHGDASAVKGPKPRDWVIE